MPGAALTSAPQSSLAVFVAGARPFSIGDVHAFAARTGRACDVVTSAGHGNRPCPATAAAVEAAIEQFRYRHELISADECAHWLTARGLTYGHLHASLARRLSGRAPTSAAEATIDGILADSFPGSARALAARIALSLERGLSIPSAGQTTESHWLQWDANFRQARAQVASAEQCRRSLVTLRSTLVQVEFETAEFDALHVAREARWCVCEDRQSLREVAQAQRYPLRVHQAFVDDLPGDWAAALTATAPGDVSAVVSDGERHLLLVPRRSIEPSLDLPEVAERVERHLADQYFNALLHNHVSWIIPMTVLS